MNHVTYRSTSGHYFVRPDTQPWYWFARKYGWEIVTMISFTEYLPLKSRDVRNDLDHDTLTDAEYAAMREFEQAQPKECSACNAHAFDPFGLGRVVHDVAACESKVN